MNPSQKLAAYGAGLVVAFAGAYGIAGAVVPDSVVAGWERGSTSTHAGAEHNAGSAAAASTAAPAAAAIKGVSLSADGYTLGPVTAPVVPNVAGGVDFTVLDRQGAPVREFDIAHEKQLHLIAVRADGAHYQHLHPTLDTASGRWWVPVTWPEAGTYRIYADFTPTGAKSSTTLTRTVQVDGAAIAQRREASRIAQVDGFTAVLGGDLAAGGSSDLTVTITRDGAPVIDLEPYLGAYGHLVALREGDLAYLHVHATGAEPLPGGRSGPDIGFAAEVPTAGRYLLYLDFQVDGVVRTAQFVVDARQGGDEQGGNAGAAPSHGVGH
ncbi:hypothetical protein [Tsukamurella sp. 1534]|uniref:hypothetical protein n=1 Tax=Tsukamurella sp. 1534 TaxID=1151061 RepID=UPI00059527E6|nr:hypothetical protein [Tsukamurella sp. 1534]